MENENIIKRTCKELGITQKVLADKIGVSIETINKASSSGEVSKQVETAINLLLETELLKTQLSDYNILKNAIKKAITL